MAIIHSSNRLLHLFFNIRHPLAVDVKFPGMGFISDCFSTYVFITDVGRCVGRSSGIGGTVGISGCGSGDGGSCVGTGVTGGTGGIAGIGVVGVVVAVSCITLLLLTVWGI
ncbi:hypothetical protein AB5G37_005251 [Salmonella enterica subsp. enterica serovar Teko]